MINPGYRQLHPNSIRSIDHYQLNKKKIQLEFNIFLNFFSLFHFSSDNRVVQWRSLLADLIEACFSMAAVVSPVVNNSSPEGNVPFDVDSVQLNDFQCDFSDAEPFLTPSQETKVDVSNADNSDLDCRESAISEAKVRLMPEYLVVCSWRSIKCRSLSASSLRPSLWIARSMRKRCCLA